MNECGNFDPAEFAMRFEVDRVYKQDDYGKTQRVRDLFSPNLDTFYVQKYTSLDVVCSSNFDWLSKINHPAFPKIYANYRQSDDAGDWHVLLMEYISGVTLQEQVEATGSFEEKYALGVMCELFSAVTALHNLEKFPIIHRDLKPSNIMLSAGNLKIVDFAAARMHKESAARDTRLLGTSGYAPPEQFGFGQSDHRSDIYALGMVAFFITRGTHVQAGQIQNFAAALEETLPGGLLNNFIAKCTQLDPNLRYQSAEDALADLEQLATIAGETLTENPIDLSGQNLFSATPSKTSFQKEMKSQRKFGTIRFWVTMPAVLFIAAIVISMSFEAFEFGVARGIVRLVEDMVIFSTFVFLWLFAVTPLSTLRRIGEMGSLKRWWTNLLAFYAFYLGIAFVVLLVISFLTSL